MRRITARPKTHHKKCIRCGKPFLSHRIDAQYDTKHCRDAGWWERWRATHKRVLATLDRT